MAENVSVVTALDAPHVLPDEVFMGHDQALLRGHRAVAAAGNTRPGGIDTFSLNLLASMVLNV